MTELVQPSSPQLAAALALLALGLSACGGSANSTATTGTAANSPATTAGNRSAHNGQGSVRDFGSPASGSEARQLEAALHGYLRARAAGHWSRACSFLAQPIRRLRVQIAQLDKRLKGKKDCAGAEQGAAEQLSPSRRAALARADVSAVRVQGDRGYVLYRAAGAHQAMAMRREGGRWKVLATAVGMGSRP